MLVIKEFQFPLTSIEQKNNGSQWEPNLFGNLPIFSFMFQG